MKELERDPPSAGRQTGRKKFSWSLLPSLPELPCTLHNAIPSGMLSSHAHCRAAAEKEADMQPPPPQCSFAFPCLPRGKSKKP